MRSIPSETLSRIASTVAVESGLPWRVRELRAKALAAYRTVEYPAANLGLPPKQPDEIRRRICEQVSKAGIEMPALPSGQSEPTPEQIEAALEAFSIEEWTGLIDSLDQTGVQALLSYIWQGADELKQRHDERFLVPCDT